MLGPVPGPQKCEHHIYIFWGLGPRSGPQKSYFVYIPGQMCLILFACFCTSLAWDPMSRPQSLKPKQSPNISQAPSQCESRYKAHGKLSLTAPSSSTNCMGIGAPCRSTAHPHALPSPICISIPTPGESHHLPNMSNKLNNIVCVVSEHAPKDANRKK